MTECAFCDDILREGLDCADLIATSAPHRACSCSISPTIRGRPTLSEKKIWSVGSPTADPAMRSFPTTAARAASGASSLRTREKITAVLKRRAYTASRRH